MDPYARKAAEPRVPQTRNPGGHRSVTYAGHILDDLLPSVTGHEHVNADSPYSAPVPTVEDCELVRVPHEECYLDSGEPCAQAGTNVRHATHRGWYLAWGSTGEKYYGPTPWDTADAIPGPSWIGAAQSILYWLHQFVAGGPSFFTKYQQVGGDWTYIDGLSVAGIGAFGIDWEFSSVSGNTLVLDIPAGAPDPRDAIGGTPLQIGDRLYFDTTKNNGAADGRFSPVITGISIPGMDMETPWESAKPTWLALTLSQDIGDALEVTADDTLPWSFGVFIGRETVEQPWERHWYGSHHYLWGSRQYDVFTSADPEWSSQVFTIGGTFPNFDDARAALPDTVATGTERTLIVEAFRAGVYVDITDDLDLTNYLTGRLSITNEPVTTLDLTGVNLGTAVRISWRAEVLRTDYHHRPDVVGSGMCRHSIADPTGTWGELGPDGMKYTCELWETASGIASYAPLCFLCNNCDAFAPLVPSDFADAGQLFDTFEQLWIGGFPVALREVDRHSLTHATYIYQRAGVASINGAFRNADVQEVDVNQDRRWPVEGGNFGAGTASAFVRGLAFAEYPHDGVYPLPPSAGALHQLTGGSWFYLNRSLVTHDTLTALDDPFEDHRRQPGEARWWSDAELTASYGAGPRLQQRQNNGFRFQGHDTSENVIIGGVPMTAGQHYRANGAIAIGNWDADLAPTDAGSAVYGIVIRIQPMDHPGQVGDEIKFGDAQVEGTVGAILTTGGGWRFDVLPAATQFDAQWNDGFGWDTQEIPYYAGGNFCGTPEWLRVRNPAAEPFQSHNGAKPGARVGWCVAFYTAAGDSILDVPIFGGPRRFIIQSAQSYNGAECIWQGGGVASARYPKLIVTAAERTSSDAYYATFPTAAKSLAWWQNPTGLGADEGYRLPALFDSFANRCDEIEVRDSVGLLTAPILGTTIRADNQAASIDGTRLRLMKGATIANEWFDEADFSLHFAEHQTDDWNLIDSADWYWLDETNGLIGIVKAASDLIVGAEGRTKCFRLVSEHGRLGNSGWMYA